MREQLELRLNLSATFWDKAPYVRVKLDDSLLFDGNVDHLSRVINWSGDLETGSHSLTIELYNKNKYQTVIEDGHIVKDQVVNIDAIFFDDIEIQNLKWTASQYVPDLNLHPSAPEVESNCVNLGYNGVWTLPFTTPIYVWLLENL